MAKLALPIGSRIAAVLPAIGIVSFGIAVIVGWLAPGAPTWLRPDPQAPSVVIQTAFGFIVAGVGLVACASAGAQGRRVRFMACVVLVALSMAVLFEHASGLSLGVDLPSLHRALQPGWAAPGRMSPQTAVAFALSAVLIAGFDRPEDRGRALVLQLLTGALLALAIVSVAMHDVSPEGLISWYRYGRMAFGTACGFIAVSISVLALIAGSRWYSTVYAGREDEKILVMALGILALAAIGISAAAFATMQRALESALSRTLVQAVADRGALLQAVVSSGAARAQLLPSRTAIVRVLSEWYRDPSDATRERLQLAAEDGLALGLRGIAILDDRDRSIVAAGTLSTRAAMEAGTNHEGTSLAWDGRMLLRTRIEVRSGGSFLGTLLAEEDQPLLTLMQRQATRLGRSGEWELCGIDGPRYMCFPQRLLDEPHELEAGGPRDEPMQRAIAGKQGFMQGEDHRGQRVIAAYGPAGSTGLGIETKIDVHEFYLPLREPLSRWWQWFIGMAIGGALLIASQMRPVARRLVESETLANARAEALARSEAALRELYASLHDGIVVMSTGGTIEFANPAAEKCFGAGPGGLAGRSIATLIGGDDRAAVLQSLRRLPDSRAGERGGDAGVRTASALRIDGTRFDVEFSIAAIGHGSQPRVVTVLRDVSARTALERMKGEFVATVSHELRTPLTSLLGSLRILVDEEAVHGEARDFLDMALRNGERLAALVNDVIDSERIESGALRFREERFEIGDVLAEAVAMHQAYAADRRVRLVLAGDAPREATVHGDRQRVMQVLANLISNAAKFSPADGEVSVRAVREASSVRVEVVDRGSGIPEEFKPRVFAKFAQADSSDARVKGGTGLGLAISKSIIERLGGTIGFESQAGRGTTFWFELPLAR